MPTDTTIFDDGEDWGEFVNDFFDEDDGQPIIDKLQSFSNWVGRSLRPLVTNLRSIEAKGQVHELRGVRFSSGAQALVWLVERGLFLYSNVVQMGDGTWGVRIGTSPLPGEGGEIGGDDLGAGGEDIVF